jgi:hypothetical protein
MLNPGEGDDRAPVHRLFFYGGTIVLVAAAAFVAVWFTNYPLHETGVAPTSEDLAPAGLRPPPEPVAAPARALPVPGTPGGDDSSPFVLGEVTEQKVIATFEQRRRTALDGDAKLIVPWTGSAPGGEWLGDEAKPETRNAFTATRSLWIPAAANLPAQTAPLLGDARLRFTLAAGLRAARLVIVFSEVTEPGELQVLRTTKNRQVIESEPPVASRMLLRSGVQEVVLDITPQLRRDLGENLAGGMLVRYTGKGRARIGLAWAPPGQAAGLPHLSAEVEIPIKLIQSERLTDPLTR